MRRPASQSEPVPAVASALVTARPGFPVWLLAVMLALVTIALYWPATGHDFVNFDDNVYVLDNPHVASGLTWENARWAFQSGYAANWHPITWLSHMLDCQLFGLKPWGHHLTNVLLHALNAALVFALLRQMTGATWRSALVAALFAVHPLRVESVAWVAERKDVLSGCFGLLCLWAYVRYVQIQSLKSKVQSQESAASRQASGRPAADYGQRTTDYGPRNTQHGSLFYFLSLFFFACGLLSKPMLVTWPFVLLLLDYWPLRRLSLPTLQRSSTPLLRLVLEKIPFFALSVAASVVTFMVQRRGGALAPGEGLALGARGENALISYGRYLGKLFWPTDLAVFYPHPGHWPLGKVLLAGGMLLGISGLVLSQRRRYPFLLMGWLWYCGTLVPAVGLVQVGAFAMADRYTYIPSLGVLIMAVWGAYELVRPRRFAVVALSAVGSTVIVLCLGLTREQLGHWQDSETLFRHTLAVTEDNYLARNNLGDALDKKGRTDEAIIQYEEALRLKPNYADTHNNLGIALGRKGRIDEAFRQFQEALRLNPNHAEAHCNLGTALAQKGQLDEAIRQFQEALRLKPEDADAYNNLGTGLLRKGRIVEAISQYQEAVRLKPDSFQPHLTLARILPQLGRFQDAAFHLDEFLRTCPRANLEAPDSPVRATALAALNDLAWLLATRSRAEDRDGARAVRFAERACELTQYQQTIMVATLAAAYAEAGRFPEAVATAERALALARQAGDQALLARNQQRLELYRLGQPYHEPAAPGPSPPPSPQP